MKKVFLIHGFEGHPNGAWRPWLMAELEKQGMYTCALAMPSPNNPQCAEWVSEIARVAERNMQDEIYLVGHSLGVPAILRYLEGATRPIAGAVLVAGPTERTKDSEIDNFFENDLNFERIRKQCENFVVIHGDDDHNVPAAQAKYLSGRLGCKLHIVEHGGHLNGSGGWFQLPQCLQALNDMMK